jgi:hypothetical protein
LKLTGKRFQHLKDKGFVLSSAERFRDDVAPGQTADPESKRPKRTLEPTQAIATIASTVGVLGAIVYGFQRFSYERFYDQFGVTPEDVGVTPSDVLSQTGLGLVVLICVAFVLLVVLLIFLALYYSWGVQIGAVSRVAATRLRNRSRKQPLPVRSVEEEARRIFSSIEPGLEARIARNRTPVAVLVVILTFLTTASWYVFAPDDAGKCAAKENGPAVRSLHLNDFGNHHITLLGVRAEPVVVTWLHGAPPKSFSDRENMVYLGEKSGSRVLYRPRDKQTIRIPEGDVALAMTRDYPTYDRGDSCADRIAAVKAFRTRQAAAKSGRGEGSNQRR